MLASDVYNLAVIGSGAGGARAALLAARRGASVLLVERNRFGGGAFHAGTLPMRSLTACARMLRQVRGSERFGIRAENVEAELADWITRQRHLVTRLASRLQDEVRDAGVEIARGRAELLGAGRLRITEEDGAKGEHEITADHLILATGARPRAFDDPRFTPGNGAVGSARDFVSLADSPRTLVIVGGGHVGCEFAGIFNALGARVTVVERHERLLPEMDPEAGERLRAEFVARGVDVRLGCESRACHEDPDTGQGVAHLGSGEDTILAEKVLLATGRRPNVEGLGLEAAGVRFDPRRGIEVDKFLQTTAPGVSAIGDVNGLSPLADAALAQAWVAVENALGGRPAFDLTRVPRCVHTDPAVAEVGLSEVAARGAGPEVCVGRARFGEVTPVLNQGEGAGGWVKLIADPSTRRLLGAVVVGERAAEWIGEFSLALSLGASVDALLAAPRAHPTFADALEVCAGEMFGGRREQLLTHQTT